MSEVKKRELHLGNLNLEQLSELIDKAKENGGIYKNKWLNVSLWVGDTPDKYGNTISLNGRIKKEDSEDFEVFYLGDFKPFKK